jgi:nucleoside-diphosphate-sugar epimerase
MAANKKVLITGAAGLVGSVLRDGLADSYDLSGVDIKAIDGFDCHVADTTDLAAIQPAFEGIDTVIDLASIPSQHSPWDVVHRNNLTSTYNSLEAARVASAKRVIFASSNHATGNYENDLPYSAIVAGEYEGMDPDAIPYITTTMPIRPDGPYGIGKAFGEAAGRYHSDVFGLSVLCMRIGTLNREGRPTAPRQFATLLSHGDLVRLASACIDAPDDIRFGVYYGVSDNKWRFWDIANSREEIGYHPQDNAEAWR